MKPLFIVANWKANKTEAEARLWLEKLREFLRNDPPGLKEIIVCPPFFLLSMMKQYVAQHELPINIGSQDVSQCGRGAYTGETPASLIQAYARYCIIGHSERRNHLNETHETLVHKVEMALGSMILPIFCVQDANTPVPKGVRIAAYEPVFAIGTGNPDNPENANRVADKLKKDYQIMHVLYGGSVNENNVKSFTSMRHIDGVLVGSASLEASSFIHIIQNA